VASIQVDSPVLLAPVPQCLLFLLEKPHWLRGTGGSPDEKRETRKALGSSVLELAYGENFPSNIISG